MYHPYLPIHSLGTCKVIILASETTSSTAKETFAVEDVVSDVSFAVEYVVSDAKINKMLR